MSTEAKRAPSLWLIAGPNGVGKTTYAMRHIARVSGTLEFINQDEIARGLYPLAPTSPKALYEAGKVSAARKSSYIRHKISFSVETTLSGRAYLRTIKEARIRGYTIILLFFYVSQVEECIRRVSRRVEMGGHDVPEQVIRRRFPRSIVNFGEHAVLCNRWSVLENSGPQPKMMAECRDGVVTILEPPLMDSAPVALVKGIADLQEGR